MSEDCNHEQARSRQIGLDPTQERNMAANKIAKHTSSANAPSAQAKRQDNPTPFAAMRTQALGHEQGKRWEQAAQCWDNAAELARAVGHKKEARERAAACRMTLRRLEKRNQAMLAAPEGTEPPASPDATAAPELAQGATNQEGAPVAAAVATAAPTSETGTPAAESLAASARKPAKTPHQRDQRLPPPGTVLRRVDRHGNVRCECTVEEHGVRYAGTMYKTLSAAAVAAAKDLGFQSASQNGFIFFGLIKPKHVEGASQNTLLSLERAWVRYRERAQASAQTSDDDTRAKVYEALHAHLNALFAIAGTAAR